jgi:hypothetical protein
MPKQGSFEVDESFEKRMMFGKKRQLIFIEGHFPN